MELFLLTLFLLILLKTWTKHGQKECRLQQQIASPPLKVLQLDFHYIEEHCINML
jgi:hypothetical protein